MNDADYIRETTLAYGAVMNMMDRIVAFNDKWEELLDMMSEVFEDEYKNKEPQNIFENVYQFLFRLYLRLKVNPEKREFNTVAIEDNNVNKWVRITNYDYKTFKWAKGNGFVSGLTNDFLDIPVDKLNNNQLKAFERRAGKE